MQQLFSQKAEKELAAALSRRRRCLLFLDFDGTLSKIVSHPRLAKLDKSVKASLEKLAKNPRVKLFVVSGRDLDDIKRRIGMDKIACAGNHGLEWAVGRVRRQVPIPARTLQALRNLKADFLKLARAFPGAIVEDKRLTLALHYRLVARARQSDFQRLAGELLRNVSKQSRLSVLSGKKIYDVRPAIKWTKGEFVKMMMEKRHSRGLPAIYLGDDVTDEDAFKLRPRVIGVKVGAARNSAAAYSVRSVGEVAKFFDFLEHLFRKKNKKQFTDRRNPCKVESWQRNKMSRLAITGTP